jgi:transposase InsO family protein
MLPSLSCFLRSRRSEAGLVLLQRAQAYPVERHPSEMMETVFKTIKSEMIWRISWQSRFEAERAIARYIDGFYNPVRRHSALGFQSPINFEATCNLETLALR